MAYIANAVLETTGVDGQPTTIEPGAVIDDFASWDYAVQLAHLTLGKVRQEGAHMPGNLAVVDGRLSMGVRAEIVDDAVTLTPEATTPLPEPTSIVEGFVCGTCDRAFARAGDLKRHEKFHVA